MPDIDTMPAGAVLNAEPPPACSYCGDEITDPEERADPRRDPNDDEVMCDDCYQEHFEFTCCWCKEYASTDVQHEMLVIEDADNEMAEYRKGVYRVVDSPYWSDGMIECNLVPSSLEWIAELPDGLHVDYYSCGHLCAECQGKIEAAVKAAEKGGE